MSSTENEYTDPKRPSPITAMLEPNPTKLRTLSELPRCKKSMMDRL
jgi:hypothetical protein